MAPSFHIGQLATRTGRSVHAIRWYEAQGLIPGVSRDRGGRRVYVPEHVQWLGLLERLRLTGMSIADMRRYAELVRLGRKSLRERQDLLKAHRRRVEKTLAEWRRALDLIDRKVEFYGDWMATGRRPAEIPTAATVKEARRRSPKPAASALSA